ncbi:MAG TPA: hypothetical protein VF278_06385 [Pirellulales bacterium]
MRELVKDITCLHCWHRFPAEDVYWRSEHRDLLGDPLLGENEQMRFPATRFDLHGNAVDACGDVCRDIACPKCHLTLPRALLERPALFVSILGTPSCGKSFYLAALATTLRRSLPREFRVDISDADTVGNQSLVSYEKRIFLNQSSEELIPLADLVPKTEMGGGLYNRVRYGDQEVSYPRPLSFTLDPAPGHPSNGKGAGVRRVLCLYDNAGEHFLPGQDTRSAPGTQHMARANYLLFLFDPTQDPRWHAAMRKLDPQCKMPVTRHAGGQEMVLREAARRIHDLRELPDGVKDERPLIIVLNKADVWKTILGKSTWKNPLKLTSSGLHAVDVDTIHEYSDRLRTLLAEHVPELVYAADMFFKRVYFLPASSLGTAPEFDAEGNARIRPCDIRPALVSIPFLFGTSLTTRGLIPAVTRNADALR